MPWERGRGTNSVRMWRPTACRFFVPFVPFKRRNSANMRARSMVAAMVTLDKHMQLAVHLGKLRVEPRVQFLLSATQGRDVVPQQADIARERIEPGPPGYAAPLCSVRLRRRCDRSVTSGPEYLPVQWRLRNGARLFDRRCVRPGRTRAA
jgi:hypothetical protein